MILLQAGTTTSFVTILPVISFVLGIAIAVLQLYVTARMAKIEEKLTNLFRTEQRDLEKRMFVEMKDIETGILKQISDVRRNFVTTQTLDLKLELFEERMKNKNH
jgi:hypothetical protein